MSQKNPQRRLGSYISSDDWSDYWKTSVSRVVPGKILIRGYPLEEMIEKLTYSEVVHVTVRGELPTPAQARTLDAVLCSIPAHQWIAAHLLAAAVTASASPDTPIPGIASGILSMGSVTVSPQSTAELIARGFELEDEGLSTRDAADRVVAEYLEAGRLVPGLGHPLNKDHDLRSTALEKVTREQDCWGRNCRLYAEVPGAFERASGKSLPVNIDGMLACVLADLGYTPAEMAGVAAIAAMPGIVAAVIEEIEDGVPLRVVPEVGGSVYVGRDERHIER
jgi:citrate synthase